MHQEMGQMSARETLRTTLLNLLEEEMGQTFALPQDDEDLRETLGLDSVDLVGLVMRIEREFRVRLSTEELGAVKKVGDLLDLMESKLAHQGSQSNPPQETAPGAG
jgi:acyl carrier protein